jgi:hypothetical protein
MKGSLLLLLLGTLGMCLAFHAAAEEPTPEAPSAGEGFKEPGFLVKHVTRADLCAK